MESFHDNCDECGEDYFFDKENTKVNIFLTEWWYNHLLVTCPNCGYEAYIGLEPAVMIHVILECKLGIRMWVMATDAVKDVFGEGPEGELNEHQEKMVAFFRFLLEEGEMP